MTEPKISIELNLSEFVNLDYLEENVIKSLADSAMSKLTGGHTESFHKMAVDAINLAINERLSEVIQERLSKPIPSRDRFGDPTGVPEKTLNQMIAEAADAALTETVSMYDGRPTRDRSPFGGAGTRLEWIVKKIATEGVEREAQRVAKEVNEKAKAAANSVLANAVAVQIAKMAK